MTGDTIDLTQNASPRSHSRVTPPPAIRPGAASPPPERGDSPPVPCDPPTASCLPPGRLGAPATAPAYQEAQLRWRQPMRDEYFPRSLPAQDRAGPEAAPQGRAGPGGTSRPPSLPQNRALKAFHRKQGLFGERARTAGESSQYTAQWRPCLCPPGEVALWLLCPTGRAPNGEAFRTLGLFIAGKVWWFTLVSLQAIYFQPLLQLAKPDFLPNLILPSKLPVATGNLHKFGVI